MGSVNVRLHLQTKLILRWGWGGVCQRSLALANQVDATLGMGWGGDGVGSVNVRLHLQTKLMLRWGWGWGGDGVGSVNFCLRLQTKLMLRC